MGLNPANFYRFFNLSPITTGNSASGFDDIKPQEIIDLLFSIDGVNCSGALRDRNNLQRLIDSSGTTPRERFILEALLKKQIKASPIFGDFVFDKGGNNAVLVIGDSGSGKSFFVSKLLRIQGNSKVSKEIKWQYGGSDGLFIISCNGEQFICFNSSFSSSLLFKGPNYYQSQCDDAVITDTRAIIRDDLKKPIVARLAKVLLLNNTTCKPFSLVRDINCWSKFDTFYIVQEWLKFNMLESVAFTPGEREKIFNKEVNRINTEFNT